MTTLYYSLFHSIGSPSCPSLPATRPSRSPISISGPFSSNATTGPTPTTRVCFQGNAQCFQLLTRSVIYQDADTQRYYTYKSLKEAALTFGKGLRAVLEWKKGDVLALFTPNSIDTPVVTWGTHWAGGVVSPANPAYTAEELAFQLKSSGAKALATHVSVLPVAKEAAKRVGLSEDRLILIGDERDPDGRIKHFTSVRNISGTTRFRRAKLNPSKDLAFIVYSSGTSGTPKGVLLSHRNIVANILQLTAGDGGNLTWNGGADGKGDRLLAFLPFYHIYGEYSAFVNVNEEYVLTIAKV